MQDGDWESKNEQPGPGKGKELEDETFIVRGTITVERLVNIVTLWPQPRPLVVALAEIRLARDSTLWEYQREI